MIASASVIKPKKRKAKARRPIGRVEYERVLKGSTSLAIADVFSDGSVAIFEREKMDLGSRFYPALGVSCVETSEISRLVASGQTRMFEPLNVDLLGRIEHIDVNLILTQEFIALAPGVS